MKREIRERIFAKYNEHCAYCGKIIAYNEMQVDHLIPKRLAETGKVSLDVVESENNYMPACRRCNHYKRGNSLETFRTMIYEIPNKLHNSNYIFKVGEDFGNIKPIYCMPIVFYFERVKGGAE